MGNITVVFKDPLEHEREVEVELDEETTREVRAFALATGRTDQQVLELAMVELPKVIADAIATMPPEARAAFEARRKALFDRQL